MTDTLELGVTETQALQDFPDAVFHVRIKAWGEAKEQVARYASLNADRLIDRVPQGEYFSLSGQDLISLAGQLRRSSASNANVMIFAVDGESFIEAYSRRQLSSKRSAVIARLDR